MPRRRGDRVAMCFAAVCKSAFGTKRTLRGPLLFVRFRRQWREACLSLDADIRKPPPRDALDASARQLCFSRNLSSEFSCTDTLLAIDLDPPASCVANPSGREYFFHWRPIGLNPTTIMAAVAARWDADLRKSELRAAPDFGDVEDCDG